MAVSNSSPAFAGFIAEVAPKIEPVARRHAQVSSAWLHVTETPEIVEDGLRRRARRQALALMVASSVVSVGAICAVWMVLHAVI